MGLTRPRLGQFQTTTTAFDDELIILNNSASGSNTKDIGIVFERGNDTNTALLWDESADTFVLVNTSEQGSTRGNVAISSYSALKVGNLVSNGITYPSSDGTNGQVVVTDGSGNLSFTSMSEASNTTYDLEIPSGTTTLRLNPSTGTNDDIALVAGSDITITRDNATQLTIASSYTHPTGAGNEHLPSTISQTEAGYLNGVTSAIQTQIDGKLSTSGGTITSNLTVTGNLTVNGTTTTVATTNMVVSDNLIELNNGASSNANDSGIVIERGSTGDNAFIGWDESADKFIVGTTTATGSSTGNLTITPGTLNVGTLQLSGTAITATATELNYVDGVTSNIQTQLSSKHPNGRPYFDDDAGTANDVTSRLSSGFWQTSTASTAEGWPAGVGTSWAHLLSCTHNNNSNYYAMQFASSFYDSNEIYYRNTNGNGSTAWNQMWHAGNDGSGSGLDADTVDGLQASSFLRSDANDSASGNLTVTGLALSNEDFYLNNMAIVSSDANGAFAARTGSNIDHFWHDDGTNATTGTGGTWNFCSDTTYKNSGNSTVKAGYFQGTATVAQYADLAENYVADNSYAIGTVLVFGGTKEVTISNTKEDKRIAGVVSTNPAYLMNSDCNGEYVVPIALQGRVPCRVVGVVEKGDLIVSSNVSGAGVAWNETRNPVAGSIIGKAIENKNSEAEEIIEVVVGVR